MRKYSLLIALCAVTVLIRVTYGNEKLPDDTGTRRALIVKKYSGMKPKVFSDHAPGVKTRINTDEKIVVLTLDACGGKKGNGYDRELIGYLKKNGIPASLFITGIWIDANPEALKEITAEPLFEVENHGLTHKPASVNGRRIYGRRGTTGPGELFDEVENNAVKIEKVTGRRPVFYRPGTAYFDDVAVKVVYDLKHIPLNYSVVSGDAAGFSSARMEKRIVSGTRKGSIIIAHMNRPGKGLSNAVKRSVEKFRTKGYRFVKLSEYRDRLK